ncbi:hypothetical protein HD806DRAFT_546042 [Xylariaceae sp. AK1471]|nr:hypothetical protein HD806DRAFT_546042 [Xylariaceae sp. AK1471]
MGNNESHEAGTSIQSGNAGNRDEQGMESSELENDLHAHRQRELERQTRRDQLNQAIQALHGGRTVPSPSTNPEVFTCIHCKKVVNQADNVNPWSTQETSATNRRWYSKEIGITKSMETTTFSVLMETKSWSGAAATERKTRLLTAIWIKRRRADSLRARAKESETVSHAFTSTSVVLRDSRADQATAVEQFAIITNHHTIRLTSHTTRNSNSSIIDYSAQFTYNEVTIHRFPTGIHASRSTVTGPGMARTQGPPFWLKDLSRRPYSLSNDSEYLRYHTNYKLYAAPTTIQSLRANVNKQKCVDASVGAALLQLLKYD